MATNVPPVAQPCVEAPRPARVNVPIAAMTVNEYYTTAPTATDMSIFNAFGIQYVHVCHRTGDYWIYAPNLQQVVARLGLYV